jgi:hypothetical protein
MPATSRAKKNNEPEYITIERFAELCGKTKTRIYQLCGDGTLPAAEQGKVPFFKTFKAYIKYVEKIGTSKNLMEERARLTRIQADIAAHEYDELTRKLVPTDLAIAALETAIVHIKGNVLAITGKALTQLPIAQDDRTRAEKTLRDIVDEALKGIADFNARKRLFSRRVRQGLPSGKPGRETDGEPVGGQVPLSEP